MLAQSKKHQRGIMKANNGASASAAAWHQHQNNGSVMAAAIIENGGISGMAWRKRAESGNSKIAKNVKAAAN